MKNRPKADLSQRLNRNTLDEFASSPKKPHMSGSASKLGQGGFYKTIGTTSVSNYSVHGGKGV